MQKIQIPRTDISSAPLVFGAANLGIIGSEEDGKSLMDTYIELGGNHIDTGRVYSDWIPGEKHRSERILGDWLAERNIRDHVLISTKGGHPDLDRAGSRLSPAQIESDLTGSLSTLRIDTVDLYWLHRDDPSLPVGPIMDCLHQCQAAGKIRFYAASNWSADRMREANCYCKERGYTGFVAGQVNWSLGRRHQLPSADPTMLSFSPEFLKFHQETGLAAMPYSSQAAGYFTLRSGGEAAVKNSPFDTPGNRRIHDYLSSVQDETGLSITQMVLAYLFSHPFPVLPLIGCLTPQQLHDTLKSVGCRLPEPVIKEINRLLM